MIAQPDQHIADISDPDIANLCVARIRSAIKFAKDRGANISQGDAIKVISDWATKTELKHPMESNG